jgi:hypothetical protein
VLESHGGGRSVAHVVEAPNAEDGMYTFVFRPDVAGPARLSITVDAVHVRGSPFDVQVRRAAPGAAAGGGLYAQFLHCMPPCGGSVAQRGTLVVMERGNKKADVSCLELD